MSTAAPHAATAPRERFWTARREQALAAVVEAVLADAPAASTAATTSAIATTTRDVRRRIDALPAWRRRDIGRVLALFASPVAGFVTLGRPRAFAACDASQRGRWLDAWATHTVPVLRTAYQSLRRLALGAHYAVPAHAAAIGFRGPLHPRPIDVPWEGPLAGVSTDREPVRRGPGEAWRVPAPTAAPRGVISARALDRDVTRRADVVVIGTGAGGAVAAATLAEAGLEVVMLEAGAWWNAGDFTEDEGALAERLYADRAMRATDDLSVQLLQGEAAGGSTTINWMIMLRTPDVVLEEWAREHGLADCSPAAMRPVFERVEAAVHARVVPDDAHSPNNRIILDGAAQLGWRARAGIINADGCVRSGFCGVGCRYDAKRGTLRTYVPRALGAGATLYTDARVERLETVERDGGRGLPPLRRVHTRATREDGAAGPVRQVIVEAPLIVLAGGAIGTPVLLERSGLGGGGVGSWLRLHPTTATIGLFDREIVGSAGIPLSTICDEFTTFDGTPYGFWLECPPLLPALGAVALGGHGAAHAALLRQFRAMSTVIALTRDGADRQTSSGRVSARRDGGISITYRLTEADARRVRASIAAAAELQLAAGAREVHTLHAPARVARSRADLAALAAASVAPNRLGLFSAHVNGTCRFGTDRVTSGANPEGGRHGARGVYIADGSLLPTAPGVNPQSTIMALATVIAERLAARYGAATRPSSPARGVPT